MAKKNTPGLPTRQQILDFIESSDQPAGKRVIARAFGLRGHDKNALKHWLRDMGDAVLIDSALGRAIYRECEVPKVSVLRFTDVYSSGQVWGGRVRGEADA